MSYQFMKFLLAFILLFIYFIPHIGWFVFDPLIIGYQSNNIFVVLLLFGFIVSFLFFILKMHLFSISIWYLNLLLMVLVSPANTPNGFFLNIFIASISIPLSFFFGLVLALGRNNKLCISFAYTCRLISSLIRGIPFLGILFFIITVGSKCIPSSLEINQVIVAWLTMSLFAGVYLSDIFYSGIHAYPSRLDETSSALGLSAFQNLIFLKLPWVIQYTMSPAINVYVGLFKETSLLIVLGLYDVLGVMQNVLININKEEGAGIFYLYVAMCYWLGANSIGDFGHWITKRLVRNNQLMKEPT